MLISKRRYLNTAKITAVMQLNVINYEIKKKTKNETKHTEDLLYRHRRRDTTKPEDNAVTIHQVNVSVAFVKNR